jgi:hypothetical protein
MKVERNNNITTVTLEEADFRLEYREQRELIKKLRGYHIDILYYYHGMVYFKETNMYKILEPFIYRGGRLGTKIYEDYSL